ncbi:MAG: hypothetical protein FWG68_07315 [Defluviitaleaceae bacterium]|nr:hypothetical protein [Defluviitaleaceae bacterium]
MLGTNGRPTRLPTGRGRSPLQKRHPPPVGATVSVARCEIPNANGNTTPLMGGGKRA